MGRPAHRGVALGVLAGDDVRRRRRRRARATRRRRRCSAGAREPASGAASVGDPGRNSNRNSSTPSDARSASMRVLAAGRPLGVEAVDGRLVGHPPQHEAGGPVARPRPHRRRRVGRLRDASSSAAAVDSANVTVVVERVRPRRLDVRVRARRGGRRRSCPRTRGPRRCARRGRPPSTRARRHGRVGPGRRGRASSSAGGVAAQRAEQAVRGPSRRSYVRSRAPPGSSLDRRQLVEVLVVVDVLVLPQQRVRDVHGVAAEGEHGQDVAAHRVADHAEALGRDADLAQDAVVRRRRPSPARPRSCSKWWAMPDVSTLRVWWTRSPFVISTRRWSRAEVGEHGRHVGQQAHGLGEHRHAGVDELADHGRRHRALGDRDRPPCTIASVNALTP